MDAGPVTWNAFAPTSAREAAASPGSKSQSSLGSTSISAVPPCASMAVDVPPSERANAVRTGDAGPARHSRERAGGVPASDEEAESWTTPAEVGPTKAVATPASEVHPLTHKPDLT